MTDTTAWTIVEWRDKNRDRWWRIGRSDSVTDGHARPFDVSLSYLEAHLGPLVPTGVDNLPALLLHVAELEAVRDAMRPIVEAVGRFVHGNNTDAEVDAIVEAYDRMPWRWSVDNTGAPT